MASDRTMTVYGVAGTGHAVGTTHFAVLLAGFLSDVRHRKVSVLEWNRSGDFMKIRSVHQKNPFRQYPPGVFCIKAEEYVPAAGRKDLLQCRDRGRDAVVIDFGVYRESMEDEFRRCDRRFVLGGVNDWQITDFAAFAADRRISAECLWSFGGETQIKLLERYLGIRVRHIPWSPEAGLITAELLRFFGSLIP